MNGLGPDFEPELEKRRLFRNALINENAKELRKNPVKEPCEVSPTGNIVLYGLQNIQGFTGFENARILVQNQTDKKENGIYYMRTDAWVRSYDANTSASLENAITAVKRGFYADKLFLQKEDDIELGVSNIGWQETTNDNVVTPELLIDCGTF